MSKPVIDPVAQFAEAARNAGLEIKGNIIADGHLHRCQISGDKRGKANGWYVLHLDGIPAGAFGSWRTGQTCVWCAKKDDDLTPAQIVENKRRMAAVRKLREKEDAVLKAQAKEKAIKLWDRSGSLDAKHPYLIRKGIKPIAAKQIKNMIVLPVRDSDGVLHSLQFIMPDGGKQFLTGGRKKGCFAYLRPDDTEDVDSDIFYVVEGWATGCSVYAAMVKPVAVAFDAGNLLPVCQALRKKYPDARIVVCADDDYQTEGNPGITKAIEAAEAVGGYMVKPDFDDNRPEGATDFNDMHRAWSLDVVRTCISGEKSNVIDLTERRDKRVKEGKKVGRPDSSKNIDWNLVGHLLDRYVLIYGTDTCYDIQEGIVMQVKNFRLAVTNDYANMWLKSPLRRMILPSQLVFDPTKKCTEEEVNLFRGFDMKPRKGKFAPILELLNHLCAESAESDQGVYDVMSWVLKWLALPLQCPGAKMRSSLVFHGPQGAGKNLFFEIISAIYGRYALVVGQEQLEMQYNDWMSGKLFLIGDEVIARQELYHQKNKLKAFITGETIQVHPKFLPLRTEKNHINVVFLSNEDQPLALEPSDRRYFVVYTPPQRTDGLYDEVSQCIKEGGIEAFYYHLMHLDLGDFSEYSRPIMTVAKRDLISLGLKPAQRFVYEWVKGYLPLPLMGCSVEQLYQAFLYWCRINGERFAPNKAAFGSSARKALDIMSERSEDGSPILDNKTVRLPFSRNEQFMVKMWIPAKNGPGQDEKIGEWAVSAMDGFAGALRKFKGSDNDDN